MANFTNRISFTEWLAARPTKTRVIELLLLGWKNKEIANEVGTSEQVVKNHLRAIYDRSGMSTRVELALFMTARKTAEADRDTIVDEVFLHYADFYDVFPTNVRAALDRERARRHKYTKREVMTTYPIAAGV